MHFDASVGDWCMYGWFFKTTWLHAFDKVHVKAFWWKDANLHLLKFLQMSVHCSIECTLSWTSIKCPKHNPSWVHRSNAKAFATILIERYQMIIVNIVNVRKPKSNWCLIRMFDYHLGFTASAKLSKQMFVSHIMGITVNPENSWPLRFYYEYHISCQVVKLRNQAGRDWW